MTGLNPKSVITFLHFSISSSGTIGEEGQNKNTLSPFLNGSGNIIYKHPFAVVYFYYIKVFISSYSTTNE